MLSFLFLLGLARPMDEAGSMAGGGGAGTTPAATVSTPASTPGQGSTPTATSPTATTPDSGQQASTTTTAADPNVNDPAYGNWKALRDQRDQVQLQLNQAQAQVQQWQAISTEAQTLATRFGYSAEDFQQAFAADPIKTLQILRQQSGNGQQPTTQQSTDPNTIQDLIRKEMEPVTSVVNQQITEAAMTKYTTAVADSIKVDPILKDAPAPVHELVKDYIDEYLASQPNIVNAMKFKGDYSSVKDAVTYISGRLHGAFSEWLKTRSASPATTTSTSPAPTGQRPTLDQIINDPSVLGDAYR